MEFSYTRKATANVDMLQLWYYSQQQQDLQEKTGANHFVPTSEEGSHGLNSMDCFVILVLVENNWVLPEKLNGGKS